MVLVGNSLDDFIVNSLDEIKPDSKLVFSRDKNSWYKQFSENNEIRICSQGELLHYTDFEDIIECLERGRYNLWEIGFGKEGDIVRSLESREEELNLLKFVLEHTKGFFNERELEFILGKSGRAGFRAIVECAPRVNSMAKELVSSADKLRFETETGVYSPRLNIGLTEVKGRIEEVIDAAKFAYKEGAREGVGRVSFYYSDNQKVKEQLRRKEIVTRIRASEDSPLEKILVYAQPIVNMSKMDRTPHFEFLFRLKEGDKMYMPGDVIDALEENRIGNEFDRALCEQFLRHLGQFQERHGHDYRANINVSQSTVFDRESFLETLEEEREKNNIPSENIILEISETVSQERPLSNFAMDAKSKGYGISIDDLGAGMPIPRLASNGLLDLIDQVKIDKFYLDNLGFGESFINTIDQLLANKGPSRKKISVVAEGIETQEQLEFVLKHKGIDYAQGYLFRRPEEFSHLTYNQPNFDPFK